MIITVDKLSQPDGSIDLYLTLSIVVSDPSWVYNNLPLGNIWTVPWLTSDNESFSALSKSPSSS